MATSRDDALAAQAAVARARDRLATVPDGLAGPIENARDAMTERIDTYGPLLDTYLTASATTAGDPGLGRPAALPRPDPEPGRAPTDRRLHRQLRDRRLRQGPDHRAGLPGHLPAGPARGTTRSSRRPRSSPTTCWARRSPGSWPTRTGRRTSRPAPRTPSACTRTSPATRDIDGVLGITTYTIDELLKVTGPITVPEYDVTIATGRDDPQDAPADPRRPGPGRQPQGLPVRVRRPALRRRSSACRLGSGADSWARPSTFQSQRLLLAWFTDAADEAFVAQGGFDGAVRQDAGDYLYPVDSNVAPASKLNAIATRSLDLEVEIDDVRQRPEHAGRDLGRTRSTNPIGKPYRELPTLEDLRILGMYFRVLVPERSRVESVSGGSFVRLTAPALVGEEAGRTVIGDVPDGAARVRPALRTPGPARMPPTPTRPAAPTA